jgi:hypothetical protein
MKIHLLTFVLLLTASLAHAHGHHAHVSSHDHLQQWNIKNERHPVCASFLMSKNDTVFLEKADGTVARFPLANLTPKDQGFVREKIGKIAQLNRAWNTEIPNKSTENQTIVSKTTKAWPYWSLGLLILVALGFAGTRSRHFQHSANAKSPKRYVYGLLMAGLLCGVFLLAGFKKWTTLTGTDPLFIDSAFQPFKPKVATRWDANWFYVESLGIPDHEMMTGIVKWQQQVPIPQCYLGTNAWQIPLNPELAAVPVPVNQDHFLRGAVAIAANGVPIFNPYTRGWSIGRLWRPQRAGR